MQTVTVAAGYTIIRIGGALESKTTSASTPPTLSVPTWQANHLIRMGAAT